MRCFIAILLFFLILTEARVFIIELKGDSEHFITLYRELNTNSHDVPLEFITIGKFKAVVLELELEFINFLNSQQRMTTWSEDRPIQAQVDSEYSPVSTKTVKKKMKETKKMKKMRNSTSHHPLRIDVSILESNPTREESVLPMNGSDQSHEICYKEYITDVLGEESIVLGEIKRVQVQHNVTTTTILRALQSVTQSCKDTKKTDLVVVPFETDALIEKAIRSMVEVGIPVVVPKTKLPLRKRDYADKMLRVEEPTSAVSDTLKIESTWDHLRSTLLSTVDKALYLVDRLKDFLLHKDLSYLAFIILLMQVLWALIAHISLSIYYSTRREKIRAERHRSTITVTFMTEDTPEAKLKRRECFHLGSGFVSNRAIRSLSFQVQEWLISSNSLAFFLSQGLALLIFFIFFTAGLPLYVTGWYHKTSRELNQIYDAIIEKEVRFEASLIEAVYPQEPNLENIPPIAN